jgi:PPOX class probable F420-dependent enzyme
MEPIDIIAGTKDGVLATIKRDGHPQLSNILYVWDPAERVVRITTTADRLKARILRKRPAAALYVAGGHFFQWAVAEGEAEVSDESRTPGDAVGRELLPLYEALIGPQDPEELFPKLVEERRVLITLRVTHIYGMALKDDPRAG